MWVIISNASYKRLDDEDKVRLWKIARQLKPVATQFEADSKDAAEKMKEGYEGFDEQLAAAKAYEEAKKSGGELPITDEEYRRFISEVWQPFNALVSKAVAEQAEKEVELDFDPLTDEAFGKLIASNDWTVDKVTVVGEFLTNS